MIIEDVAARVVRRIGNSTYLDRTHLFAPIDGNRVAVGAARRSDRTKEAILLIRNE